MIEAVFFQVPGVYKISNSANGKFYIGSSNNLKNRHRQHFQDLRANRHRNNLLQRAWNKYGEKSFSFEIICECKSALDALDKEQFYLDTLAPFNRETGYNIRVEANSNAGCSSSDDAKENIRRARIGKEASEETRRKMSLAQKDRPRQSEDAIRRSSEKRKGAKRSPNIGISCASRFRSFNDAAVSMIRADRQNGMTYRSLAEKHNSNYATVYNVVNRIGIAYA